MTEQKIIYSLLETIRNSEITDDERMTEAYIRQLVYDYRNDMLKDMYEISEELYQRYILKFRKEGDVFVSDNLTGIIYDRSRFGIQIYDYGDIMLPVTSKEEALNAQKSRFYVPPYLAYIYNKKMSIIVNTEELSKLDSTRSTLNTLLNSPNSQIEISAILADPSQGIDYNWKTSPFPFFNKSIKSMRQNILRQEFGILSEVKKDEVQNARADNIIYQDESKLLK